jgi:hypothetical protein
VQASFKNKMYKREADQNRQTIVEFLYSGSQRVSTVESCVSLVRKYMGMTGSEYDGSRRYASLVVANLTMSEGSKALLLNKLGFTFFLQFPPDLISQRNAALCLAELFEDESNRRAALADVSGSRALSKPILETLRLMCRSADSMTRDLAVKSLTLLASCRDNVECLLSNGVLEVFHKHTMNPSATGQFVWRGMKLLSQDTKRLLAYAVQGPDSRCVVVDDVADGLDDAMELKCAPESPPVTVRLNVPLVKSAKIYYECVMMTGGGGLKAGVVHSNWVPMDNYRVGDDMYGFSLCTSGQCGWHNSCSSEMKCINWKSFSAIGILITLNNETEPKMTVQYTVDGVDTGIAVSSPSQWEDASVMLACSLSTQAPVAVNIGASAFVFQPPEGYQSVVQYCRGHGMKVPQEFDVWDIELKSWRAAASEGGRVRHGERLWAVNTMLFLDTLDPTDDFFASPVNIESAHPNVATSMQHVVSRPGASMFEVHFEKLRSCRTLGAREVVRLYSDAHERQLSFQTDQNDSSVDMVTVVSDVMMFSWQSERPSNAVPGWGYKLSVHPKYGEQLSRSGKVRASVEESKHPYTKAGIKTQHLSLDSAEAMRIVFDPLSNMDSSDNISFYLDSDCNVPVEGGCNLTGTSFPGVGDAPPLLIEQSECYYTFSAVYACNKWGYKFECTACKTRINEAMSMPGAVKRESPHPYTNDTPEEASNADDFSQVHSDFVVEKVRVKGKYHACVLFSSKCKLSSGDSVEIHLSDPSVDEGPSWMTITDAFPKDEIYVPQTLFWVKFNKSYASGDEYGYEFVAYDSYDLFTAIQYSPYAVTIETTHPYANDAKDVFNIDISRFPVIDGAREVGIVFDPRSSTEHNYDYLMFTKTADGTDSSIDGVSRKYSGRNGSQNFPLSDDPHIWKLAPDLDAFFAKFVSDGSNTDWGVKCVVYNPRGIVKYDPTATVLLDNVPSMVREVDTGVCALLAQNMDTLLSFCTGTTTKIKTLVASILCNISHLTRNGTFVNDAVLEALNDLLRVNDPWLNDVVIHITKNVINQKNRSIFLRSGLISSILETWVKTLGKKGQVAQLSIYGTDAVLGVLTSSENDSGDIISVLVSTLSPSHWCAIDDNVQVMALRALEILTSPPCDDVTREVIAMSSNLPHLLMLLSHVNNSDIICRALHILKNLVYDEDFLPFLTAEEHTSSLKVLFSLLLSSDEEVRKSAQLTVEVLVRSNKYSSRGKEEGEMLASQYNLHVQSTRDVDDSMRPSTGLQVDASVFGPVTTIMQTQRPRIISPSSWDPNIPLDGDENSSYQQLFRWKLRSQIDNDCNCEAIGHVHDDVLASTGFTIAMWVYVDADCFSVQDGADQSVQESMFFVAGSAAKGKKLTLAVSSANKIIARVPKMSVLGDFDQCRLLSSSVLAPSTWNFVAVSVDFSSGHRMSAKLFHGTQVVASKMVEDVTFPMNEIMGANPWYLANACEIGMKKRRTSFKGALENVRIYCAAAIDSQSHILLEAYSVQPDEITLSSKIFRTALPVIADIARKLDEVEECTSAESLTALKTLLLLSRSDLGASCILKDSFKGVSVVSRIVKMAKQGNELLANVTVPEADPVVVQSEHPYPNNMTGDGDHMKEIDCEVMAAEGYRGLKIWFDARSSSETNLDYAQFYLSAEKTDADKLGGKYCGGFGGSAKNYPTRDAPLVLHSLKIWVRFFSDYSNVDWGWKIYAMPTKEVPMMIEDSDHQLVFESSHPYSSNANVFHNIEVDGESALVYFSPETETELNYDYVQFFKDDSHTDVWGVRYSGGRNGTEKQFPSREMPLTIPSNKFVCNFVSDSR